MEKLELMKRQLSYIHDELRKVKKFHKDSSKNFKTFFNEMNNTIKVLNRGNNMFNDFHYFNLLNLKIIEYFTIQIFNNSMKHSTIHRSLKDEGNKLKVFKKEVDKRIKTIKSSMTKEYKNSGCSSFTVTPEFKGNETHIIDLNLEIDSIFRELTQYSILIREKIKESFDNYIEGLCSFSETKEKLQGFHEKTDKNYNDCSPLFDRKFDLLLNLNNENKFNYDQSFCSNICVNSYNNINENSQDRSCSDNKMVSTAKETIMKKKSSAPELYHKENYKSHQNSYDLDAKKVSRIPFYNNSGLNITMSTPVKTRRIFPNSSNKVNNANNFSLDDRNYYSSYNAYYDNPSISRNYSIIEERAGYVESDVEKDQISQVNHENYKGKLSILLL